jgi:hypothetical protein
MPIYQRLTDREFSPSAVTLNDLIHIVITGDTSQSPAGSSYKVTLGDVSQAFSGGNISVSANTGLGVSANTLFTTYNTLLDPNLTMPVSVGGIPVGTSVNDISGKTFVTLFNDLLFPTVLPTYTIPTITLQGVSNVIDEVGRTITPSLTVIGVKNDAGPFTQLRILRNSSPIGTYTSLTITPTTNIPPQFNYVDPNNPNFTYTSPVLNESFVLPAPAGSNTSAQTTYKSDGNYDSGLPKKNNKGNNDTRTPLIRSSNAPQLSANNFESITYTYTSIYPYFWGVSGTQPSSNDVVNLIESGSATKVVSSANGTVTIPFNVVTPNYLWVAIFSGYPEKTKWFVNALNQGNIGGSLNLFGTPIIESINSPNSYWTGINFKIYITNYQTTNNSIELRN